jgi:phage major head subunit gpT-like protein
MSKMRSEEVVKLTESIQRRHGFNFLTDTEKFPVRESGFSWKSVLSKLEEADSATSFPQVLRAGVQNIANEAYKTVPTSYEDWVTVVNSDKDTELYAPIQGIGFPRQVGRQELYPEVSAAGLDISLKNRKYGTMFAVEDELIQDDQTGQFQKQAALLGEYMKLLVEALVYGKLASVSGMKYAEFDIPVCETKPTDESTYPWTQTFVGGGANRPASYGVLNQANIQSAKIALLNQKNKLGLKMAVDGSRIIHGPKYVFDSAILMNSAFYPSGAATAGSTGGAFAINPLKGLADITVSRFMFKNDGTVDGTSNAWYLVDDSKPWFIVQLREAMAVLQEAPNAGDSFNRDVVRFKVRMRGNADFIDSRFAWQGNDGSV